MKKIITLGLAVIAMSGLSPTIASACGGNGYICPVSGAEHPCPCPVGAHIDTIKHHNDDIDEHVHTEPAYEVKRYTFEGYIEE